jgi:predicted small secreted protein
MNLRTKLFLLLAGAGALLMVSCETFAGMGRDIQRAGEGIENSGEGRQW